MSHTSYKPTRRAILVAGAAVPAVAASLRPEGAPESSVLDAGQAIEIPTPESFGADFHVNAVTVPAQ